MLSAALLPLFWGLAGVIAVAVLGDHRASPVASTPRIDVPRRDHFRPAA